jgi:hypothetical protein
LVAFAIAKARPERRVDAARSGERAGTVRHAGFLEMTVFRSNFSCKTEGAGLHNRPYATKERIMPDPTGDELGSPLAPAESPAVTAHLSMLQAIVARLAGNSAQCKTWCVVIVSALFGLAGATKSERIAAAAIIPIVIFGFVDAAYLANERAYRDLYNRVVVRIRNRSYGLADYADLTAPPDPGHYFGALSSWSIWPVYLGLIVAYALVLLSGLLT